MTSQKFKLVSKFKPAGDQPKAIKMLADGITSGAKNQTLLGVTGSGKTFTMASVIEKINRPVLVISPNKVLAAQLYAEFKSFFPKNAVEYFVSYYDYYQPEAYIPQTDTYIEKDAAINEHIDKLRLKATSSLVSRRDVIIVASVSCIYNIGSPKNFSEYCVHVKTGMSMPRKTLMEMLVQSHYERNEVEFASGKFRAKGNTIDIFPSNEDYALRIGISDEAEINSIYKLHPVTGDTLGALDETWIYPAKHFVSSKEELEAAIALIKAELAERLAWFNSRNKPLEAERLEQRTLYDIEMMKETGFCHGIENYSRHIADRKPGERPHCLLDYFPGRIEGKISPSDFLLFIDESHVTAPQIRGMYEGDRSRKQTLVDFGFRLPSALDNRPLKFNEFEALMPQTVFVSATPGQYELAHTPEKMTAEQIIRPTGLVDPPVFVLPTKNQIQDVMNRIKERARKGERTFVMALTKRTAEDLSAFLTEKGLRTRYIHSDIDTLARLEILGDLRRGAFDALIGINLLREGLDIPEVSLIAILDADNEGFLRSHTTLVQIAGRAARNLGGEVILYADRITGSMKKAMDEMSRRRALQERHNALYDIKPATIKKAVHELEEFQYKAKKSGLSLIRETQTGYLDKKNLPRITAELENQMRAAADSLDFELAAELRDRLFELKEMKAQNDGKRSSSGKKSNLRKKRKQMHSH